MIFNHLITAYTQIENMTSNDPAITEKLSNLAAYIHENGQAIQDGLLKHEDHLFLLRKIGQIKDEEIHNSCELLELKVLLKGDDPKKMAEWVLRNKEGVTSTTPGELFHDLSNARKLLIKANLLEPEVGSALSDLITCGLGLKGETSGMAIVNKTIFSILQENSLEALAHWINSEKVPLCNTGLSKRELEEIAPYLHYVNCSGIGLDDPTPLIQLCKNAYHLYLPRCEIQKLEQLPPRLQTLDCNGCKKLTSLDLSNYKQLKELNCSECPVLTLDLSKNEQLRSLNCNYCKNLGNLDLSHNTELQFLFCTDCSRFTALDLSHNERLQKLGCNGLRISALDLSHNQQLQELGFSLCPNLTTLDLSHNTQLKKVSFNDSRLIAIDLSHNTQLEYVDCDNSPNLTFLGHSLSNTLERLDCDDCPRLTQLPQLPPRALVFSGNSPCGMLNTFEVDPLTLEKDPKQVLLNLGKILLQNSPFPNIVYLNSPGIDAGGLRRQLVATLCENLFKKDEEGYDIPVLDDVTALQTFARLMGIGLPTGTNLHPSFFHALFALSDQELELPLSEPLKQKLYMARHGLTECEPQEVSEESNLLTAIAIIAKELHALLGQKFRAFERNIPEFIVNVQGSKVTKESLKQNIACENWLYKKWIDSFIDELPQGDLKRFVMLLTGSYTLGDGPITFEVYPEREHLKSSTVIHTCSKSMDLPGDLNKDLLHQELKAQLSLIKSFNAS
jgi:hypothetical protein